MARLKLALAALFVFSGCRERPAVLEYVPFRSSFADFECLAPKGWQVESAQEGDSYRVTIFLGPEDPKALWGRPRLVASWHAFGKPFRMSSGETGKYDSADDYLRQTLAKVWGPDPQYVEPKHPVSVDGRPAERLVIRVEKDEYMSILGAKPVKAGGGRLWRRDSAVLVPGRSGFYAFVYPAVERSQARYAPAYEKLLESLRFLKESPVE
ncbi:MAG: hypothetical protein HY925_16645 [Elusimicrobia bacterium]|nr:hypothetical protein [Elusimicrobiota bacterium]